MGGEYQEFPSNFFLSHSAENFRRGTLQCFTNFGCRGILYFRGLYHDFRFSVEFFCLTVPKFIAGETFCAVFQKSCGSEKV